jgi:hypothetical protein
MGLPARRFPPPWSVEELSACYHPRPTHKPSLGEFSNMSELQQAASSEGFKYAMADYDRAWGTRVTRTRDILEKVQYFSR